jgi:uncharacterized protein involved in exopolysaccharide biosynthesis
MTSKNIFSDDEIDIRELIHTLFRYKWIILGITLVAAVAVFIFSKYVQPRSYTAQAQVLITKPLYTTNLETRIQIVPQTPDAGVLKELALADDLLMSVYTSTEVTAVLKEGFPFDQFIAGMSAKLSGTTKIELAVSSVKPETAAIIVNEWAKEYAARINTLYNVNEKARDSFANETEKTRLQWDKAEKNLLEKLPDGIVDTKKIVLENKKSTLTGYLDTITKLDLLSRDAKSLQLRLVDLPADRPLNVEYLLSLIDLYQRSVRGLEGTPVHITELNTLGDRTVGDANASLDALINSLGTQGAELQANLEQLKQDITKATLELEAADYQLTQLTTERDLALNAYQAVSAQFEETQIELDREDPTAKVASQALTPQQPISNHTLMKTILAGVLALALSCFGALLINWWRASAPAKLAS